MTAVAINQSCELPWGHFALLKAADAFVFYDDVQLTSNTSHSFFARVQLKTAWRSWLTVAVRKSGRLGQPIGEVDIDLSPYPQLHGAFEPYVTALDLLANTGHEAAAHVNAHTVPWREMIDRHAAVVDGAR